MKRFLEPYPKHAPLRAVGADLSVKGARLLDAMMWDVSDDVHNDGPDNILFGIPGTPLSVKVTPLGPNAEGDGLENKFTVDRLVRGGRVPVLDLVTTDIDGYDMEPVVTRVGAWRGSEAIPDSEIFTPFLRGAQTIGWSLKVDGDREHDDGHIVGVDMHDPNTTLGQLSDEERVRFDCVATNIDRTYALVAYLAELRHLTTGE